MKSKKSNSAKYNPTPRVTQPPSSRSTFGHMPWFWLTSDGHYSFYDGNNNFNAVLMIVIIMLGTHSPNSVLIAVQRPQRGVSELTSKGMIYLTVECRALQHTWATVFFFILLLVNFSFTVHLRTERKTKGLQWFSFSFFLADLHFHIVSL